MIKAKREIDLKVRTKQFALRIIKLYSSMSKSTESQVIGKQLLRSGTSVGANYREASRARTKTELISKMGIALQELEETSYWLELLVESNIFQKNRLSSIESEAKELNAILTASIKTAKSNNRK